MQENQYKRFLERNILFTHEVADKLNVSRQRVTALRNEGKLLPFKMTQNGAVYLLQDVIKYMEERGIYPRYENLSMPKFVSEESNTFKDVKYAKANLEHMGEIERVAIFFEDIDAAIENYFVPLDELRYGDLMYVQVAHMVITDSNGDEMWLSNCNCGYGGSGPHGSHELLLEIGIPEELAKNVFNYPVVKFVKNEDGEWEVNCRQSEFDFRCMSEREALRWTHAAMYWHQGRLTLLQEKRGLQDDARDVLEKYWAFIPQPVEYLLFLSDEQAIDNGFFDPSEHGYWRGGAYKLIIRDYSGRQLWLDPWMERDKPLKKQAELREVLELCGFEVNEGTDLRRWLGTLLKQVDPNEPMVGKREPF